MRLISTGDVPELIAIFLFALYASLLPEGHRDALMLLGALVLAAFLTWRHGKKIERRNRELRERLRTEVERLNIDERAKEALLRALDDVYSEAKEKGFAVKVLKLNE